MSTKIYNGFRFRNPDIIVIREQLLKLQECVKAHVERRCAEMIACACMLEIEGDPAAAKMYGIRERGKSVVLWAAIGLEERLRKAAESMERDPFHDFKASITVIPIKGKTLGMYYGERWFEDIVRDQPWFIDYHYQNQCDPPEENEVSRKEWRQREKDWDIALEVGPHKGIPANAGFDMQISLPYWEQTPITITSEQVLQAIPSLKKRAHAAAYRDVKDKHCRQPAAAERDHNKIFEIAKKYGLFEKTKEFRKEMNERTAYWMKTLRKKYTKEDLLGKEK